MSDIADLFDEDGPLAGSLDGYRPRAGQIEMARFVQAALGAGGQHVFEAGTGIGKTYAYLAPIIQGNVTALISTGSRALQDQLSQRDVPAVASALGRSVSLAVLKGRANYICKKAVAEYSAGGELFDGDDSRANPADWEKITLFAAASEHGDISGISDVPAGSPLLGEAVSTRASCATQECKYFNECFLYKARARAREADVVIVNHHLFLSDMRLRDEGIAELLPSRDVALFDEAHILPQLAPQFFGAQFSARQTLDMTGRAQRFLSRASAGAGAPLAAVIEVKGALEALLETANAAFDDSRESHAALMQNAAWRDAARRLHKRLAALSKTLQNHASANEKIATYARQATEYAKVLGEWLDVDGGDDNNEAPTKETQAQANAPAAESESKSESKPDAKSESEPEEDDDPLVRWAEYREATGMLTLHSAPMTGRLLLARQWQQLPAAVFTSATLSVSGDFSDFCEVAGLPEAQTRSWESPYDFANRSLLLLPPDLPAPAPENAAAHTRAVADVALPLIRANNGKTFFLFSSWRALDEAHDHIAAQLAADGFEALRQGDAPNDKLLARFRRGRRAVLLGTRSFWQGVDVRGDALSLLVVDKIPFAAPNDPLLRARDDWRKRRGENAFMRNQLSPAVLLMKQVAGRLIRDYDDYGVFIMADPRLTTKRYGKVILSALPPMPVTRSITSAEKFLRKMAEESS